LNTQGLESFEISVDSVLYARHGLDNMCVPLPPPTMFLIEPNPNRRPADPTQKRGPVSIRQIDDRVELPVAQSGDEARLCRQRSFVQNYDLV
jgi:hypothetical protein